MCCNKRSCLLLLFRFYPCCASLPFVFHIAFGSQTCLVQILMAVVLHLVLAVVGPGLC